MTPPRRTHDAIGATLRARSDALFDLEALPRLIEVDVDHIDAHPDQPRKFVDPVALTELAQSIERHGLLQPIVVQATGANRYVLVAGQRRLLAHRQLGRERVAALLATGDRDELALIENLQREDLPPLDQADALVVLKDRHGYNQDELAKVLAKAKSTISELLSLTRLPAALKADIRAAAQAPTKSILIEIAKLDDELAQRALWERLKNGGTVRQARRAKISTPTSSDELDQVARATERLLHRLEAVVSERLQGDDEVMQRLRRLHGRLATILGTD